MSLEYIRVTNLVKSLVKSLIGNENLNSLFHKIKKRYPTLPKPRWTEVSEEIMGGGK